MVICGYGSTRPFFLPNLKIFFENSNYKNFIQYSFEIYIWSYMDTTLVRPSYALWRHPLIPDPSVDTVSVFYKQNLEDPQLFQTSRLKNCMYSRARLIDQMDTLERFVHFPHLTHHSFLSLQDKCAQPGNDVTKSFTSSLLYLS